MTYPPEHTHNPDKMAVFLDCPRCRDDQLWMDNGDLILTIADNSTRAGLERLMRVANNHGVSISYIEAALAWGANSQYACASWLTLYESDESCWTELQPWIAKAQRRAAEFEDISIELDPREFNRIYMELPPIDRFTSTAHPAPNLRLPGLVFIRGDSFG